MNMERSVYISKIRGKRWHILLIEAGIACFVMEFITQGARANKCLSQETCGSCIAESPQCSWCSQEDYTEKGKARCDLTENLEKVCDHVTSPKPSSQKLKDQKLSEKGAEASEAIQVRPQEIKIRIRPNSGKWVTVAFQQAVDYPVDLYYLMDLSNSMKDDKAKLANLGNKFAEEMGGITKNFRLGFGSFVDKVATPFVLDANKSAEPCTGCAPPYGFRNSMPLSLETYKFARMVNDTPISGNLDAPEGGLDAIMQAVVCTNEIGWRNQSRKLVVFTTDNGFHYAGDGKLAGIVAPNDELCHLDGSGLYTHSELTDYPSLSQLNRRVREHKVNLIFAVTADQLDRYRSLSERLAGSTTGRLDKDSSNVVGLVRTQYEKITSSVKMTDNTAEKAPHVRLSYFSKCFGDFKQKTNVCTGLKVGMNVTFEVKIEAGACPKERLQWNSSFEIFPVGLPDQLVVHLEMICECECERPWQEEAGSARCSGGNGTYECGVCSCYGSRYGKECECDALLERRQHSDADCYAEDSSIPCSGKGVCRCGKCFCYEKQRADEKVFGKYCECDNYSCDRINGLLCNGPEHGVCGCGGRCDCLPGWSGDNCGCRDTSDTCIAQDGKLCSDHGKCVCGECDCEKGSQEYFGKYCDHCSSCPGICDDLNDCVGCFIASEELKPVNCSGCPAYLVTSGDIKAAEREKACSFYDKEGCRYSYKYAFDESYKPTVHLRNKKECPSPAPVVAIASGVSGGVVAVGLFLLLLWKLLTTVHDRRELAKFEKEKLKAQWQQDENPLYKQATSTFQNPAYDQSDNTDHLD